METLDQICEKLNLDRLEKVQPVKDLAAKVGVKASHLGLGGVGLVALLVIFSYGVVWISFLIGFLYPAYKSFKALETKDDDRDDQVWLTYWIVFGTLHVFDGLINYALGFIPGLGLIKIGLYVWLFHPKTLGAKLVYEKGFRPFLLKYEGDIDKNLAKGEKYIEQKSGSVNEVAGNIKKEAINRVVS